jgi:hypothetical protein
MITLRSLPLYIMAVLATVMLMSKGVAVADKSFIAEKALPAQITSLVPVTVAGASIPTSTSFSYSQLLDIDNQAATQQVEAIQNVLSKYPDGLLNKSGMKGILLVKNLAWGGQFQVALPDVYQSGYLIISIDDVYANAQDGQYITYVVHHEIGHFIQRAINLKGNDDGDWLACGTQINQYAKGGLAFNGEGRDAWAIHPEDGFVTSYSTASLAEDIAEVHAQLRTAPERLYSLTEKDKILSCKVGLLAERLTILSK